MMNKIFDVFVFSEIILVAKIFERMLQMKTHSLSLGKNQSHFHSAACCNSKSIIMFDLLYQLMHVKSLRCPIAHLCSLLCSNYIIDVQLLQQ